MLCPDMISHMILNRAILPHDRAMLHPHITDIATLIEEHPFREKIEYLLTHPELATILYKDNQDRDVASNCIGTALFVAGISLQAHPVYGYAEDLNPHMEAKCLCQIAEVGALVCSYSNGTKSWHVGIYIGKAHDCDLTFAQHGYGGPFCIELIRNNYINPWFYIPLSMLV